MGVPISNVTRRVVYAASGTGPYNFTFEILAAGDVAVYKDDSLLTLTTDYTVTINANGTGYITLTASPTGATQIAIVGNRTIQRTTDFVTGGDFFANTVNDEMDQQTIFAQQNAEAIDRSLKAPQTDPTNIDMTLPRAALRAGKTLAFDAQGNPSLGDTLGTNRGNWAAGTLYYVRDIVKDTTTSNIWQCVTQHTSSGSQPISTNADAAKWFLLVDAAAADASATAAAASASAAATSASDAATSASNAASSASTASTQASNASTSATNAANSATAAASSASTASTQASNAATSATNAANSATSASNSASSASTSATNASNSATSAATSASQASTSASNAASSASTATTQASNAATSATNAANSATASASSATDSANSATASANSATAAAGSATSAAASAAAAAASLDNFDDRYLGAKSSDPTVDNDGDPLVTGALYYRTTNPIGMKVWDGSQWLEASAAQQASLVTYEYVATAGQTTFSGADVNGVTLSYTVGNVLVTLNGSRLRPGDEFTASTGTSIVLVTAAAAGDELIVDALKTFDVANTYTKGEVDGAIAGRQPLDSELTTLAGMSSSRATFLASANDFAFRNRIINGDMRIDQRNAGASVTPAGVETYTVDRFSYIGTQASKFTFQQNAGAVTPPTGFTNYLGFTVAAAVASPAAGDQFAVYHKIEGLNCSDLAFGSASAATVTVSFWIRSSLTGTFSGGLVNSAGNRSYVFNYTITAANTWEQKTVTIAGDTTGTWLTTNGIGIQLRLDLGSGSNQDGTASAWQAADKMRTSSSVRVVSTAGATFYITGVQLEAGSVATPFERRDIGRELVLCQRYFENNGSGWFTTSSNYGVQVYFRTTKRATPTISVSSGTVSGSNYIGTNSFRMDAQGPLDVNSWSASSEL